ncbi:translocation/assembly module TamB domain-containing protein [Fulvivirga lutea]|uniref:Translocation/assembly module TamB n=1 Tax=Fulvivirga lutea TaxID=2810512 RepID=A0A974WHD4_9BACT|nr:translocation/assembly module TamB domain-containing protein [Fulvivirga lutea]QSE97157.1 translocation/assembly module TamB [Fulvivirga lutea]
MLLLFATAGAIQFPYVQTKLVNYLNEKISTKLGYNISLQHISIWWFDSIDIEGVQVIDPEGNTMISAAKIELDFDLTNLLDKENHHLDDIVINKANVYLTKVFTDTDSLTTLNINDFIKKIKDATRKEGAKSRAYISCDNINIFKSNFSYNDQQRDSLTDRFDYYHFEIDSINGRFENIYSVSDTFGLKVNSLKGYDKKTKMKIDQMKTSFAVSQSAMLFDDLELKVGQSIIKDSVRFDYNSTADMSNFNNKVLVNASLNNSIIHTNDLSYFVPQLRKFNEKYTVSGNFNGLVRSFLFSKASISFGSGTTIRGKIRMTGLPDFDETFIDFDLYNSYITTTDIKPYVKEKTFKRLQPLEHISFTAEFLGFPSDFVALGTFYTQYGRIDSDINLKISEDISKSSYSGRLSMQNFDLGGYTNNDLFGALSVNGNIKGSGFTLETADFNLNGTVETVGINNYDYQNIVTNARFAKEFFEGSLKVDDPNLKLDLTGAIDLRGGLNFFNIKAKIDTTDLHALNLTEEEMLIKSQADVNARGLKIDEILGAANLGKTYLKYRNNSIQIDSLSLISDRDEEQRIILLKTNLLNATASGEFEITQLYTSLKNLLKEYRLSLRNNSDEIKKYYLAKNVKNEDYNVEFNINIKDLNPLLEVFAPNVYISPSTKLNGSITGGYTSIIALESRFDSLIIDNNVFANNDLQVNISKISDSTNVLAMVYAASKTQEFSKVRSHDMIFEGIWDNRHIEYDFEIEQSDYDNNALITGSVDFLRDSVQFRFSHADLKILDESWSIEKNNLITLSGKSISFENIKLYSKYQSISLIGKVAESPDAILELNIDSLELDNLNTILNKNIEGKVNGYASIKNVYSDLLIDNNIVVDGLSIDNFLVGNVISRMNWDNNRKESQVKCTLNRLGYKILDLNGTYSPYSSNQLKLKAYLNGTELKIIEPFLSSFFTNISGSLNGEVLITGSPDKPNFNGNGTIDNAHLHVNYLNTDYDFDGEFYLSSNKIGFRNIKLTDIEGQSGSLNGYISHDYFKNMGISMNADFQDFQILNTTSKDNSLFYGNGETTGTISFYGPLNNMNITANARTEKGTKIYIPIGDTETIEQEEYINFVDFGKDLNTLIQDEIESVDLRGIKLDFDLDITNDAYCEIIFDIKSGDIIRGRGNGDIKMEIDTKGEFNMFGDFNIEEGGYNFTLYNLINKEFEILPGSKISWYGDPYQGILDINATYSQLASFLPLLSDQQLGGDTDLNDVIELRRKYPVNVLLEIDGALLSPSVDFDITTGTLPRNIQLPNGDPVDLEFEFLKFKNSIDEQELKRQVFSLIVLRKFSPLQSFNTGGSITSSVSELLSNQLSYWITQVDENLEIDVDFGKLDQEAFNTFQLRLSYSFFDGRLRVTRDGGFTNQANRADVSSIAGDWTVEYLLTENGKFKVKMYNRTNYNPINPTEENQNTVTTGFSLIHTQSFDEIKDLFKKSRENAREENEEEESEEEDINAKAVMPEEDEAE